MVNGNARSKAKQMLYLTREIPYDFLDGGLKQRLYSIHVVDIDRLLSFSYASQ